MANERRREYENWHLDKRVNVGHILTTIALAGAMFSWAMTMDSRMTRIEVQQQQSQRSDDEIKVELRDINMKMDRLIESLMNGNRTKQ